MLGVPRFDPAVCRPVMLIQDGDRVRVRDAPFDVRHVELHQLAPMFVRRLPVAPPSRALADLHLVDGLPDGELIDAVDRTRNHLRLDVVDLAAQWARNPRHPGARLLLQMAGDGVFDVDSGAERRVLAEIFALCELPPDSQVYVLGNFRADFVYAFAGVIIEYYGMDAHAGRLLEDSTRTLALQAAGWYVIVLTKAMMRDPVTTARFIDRVRRERERLILTGEIARPALPAQPDRRLPLRTLVPAA